ncbi:hypothetical protein J6590_031596 [Homalodisca vitripennis]|nr:hypothetical protein J6590_031596 [Homalodisca vitripennis]
MNYRETYFLIAIEKVDKLTMAKIYIIRLSAGKCQKRRCGRHAVIACANSDIGDLGSRTLTRLQVSDNDYKHRILAALTAHSLC